MTTDRNIMKHDQTKSVSLFLWPRKTTKSGKLAICADPKGWRETLIGDMFIFWISRFGVWRNAKGLGVELSVFLWLLSFQWKTDLISRLTLGFGVGDRRLQVDLLGKRSNDGIFQNVRDKGTDQFWLCRVPKLGSIKHSWRNTQSFMFGSRPFWFGVASFSTRPGWFSNTAPHHPKHRPICPCEQAPRIGKQGEHLGSELCH